MFFLMIINLYTTRVVLNVLGIEDYGIYEVIGGMVALFGVVSQSLSTAGTRFLNFEMGRDNLIRLKEVFSTSVTIQLFLTIIVFALIEFVGVWYLNNKIVISEDRLEAAFWVTQFSILTFCVNLISVPYNSAIIAHERMSAFAYISIYEGITKLAVAYFLLISPFDKLVGYAFLLFLIQLSVRGIFIFYCRKHFEECQFKLHYNSELIKELFGFAGWNFIGASSVVIRTQGGNILINLFAGPTINAARGIANLVNRSITGFSNNFMVAVNPQIIKSYASGDIEYMETLVNTSAKYSFFLLWTLSLPIILNIDYILLLWLKEVPAQTNLFVILTMIYSMMESFSSPLITAQLATGNVRNYQLIVGGLNLLNIPISYLLMRLGYPVICFLLVAIILSFVCLIARLILVRKNSGLNSYCFVRYVFFKAFAVVCLSFPLPGFIAFVLDNNLSSMIISFVISIISSVVSILFIGCSLSERQKLYCLIKNRFSK